MSGPRGKEIVPSRLPLHVALLCALHGALGTPRPELDVCVSLFVTLDEVFQARVKRVTLQVQRWAGEAVLMTRESVYVSLAAGAGGEYRFPLRGDEDIGCRGRFGDVVVQVHVRPHERFRVDDLVSPADLHCTVDVSLLDYLYGARKLVELLDGSFLEVEYPAQRQRASAALPGRGLPLRDGARGTLYVFFELRLPRIPPARLAAPLVRGVLASLLADEGGAED